MFFNIKGSIEESRESSKANIMEAKSVINILNKIEIIINEQINDSNDQSKRISKVIDAELASQLKDAIGIITPYTA